MYVMNETMPWGNRQSRLEEMAMVSIADKSEGLPFKIIVKLPDVRGRYHAHIFTLDSKTELGTFVITDEPPRQIEDFVEYRVSKHKGLQNIPDEWLQMIIDWAWQENKRYKRRGFSVSNWAALLLEYDNNNEGRG